MRTPNGSLSALAICALFITGGCKPSIEKVVVGHWKGTMDVNAIAGITPAMKAFMNPALSLDVREDKTCSFTMSVPMEGKWEAADGKITFHPEKFMGMPFPDFKAKALTMAQSAPNLMGDMGQLDHMNQPFVFGVSEDGKTLRLGATELTKS